MLGSVAKRSVPRSDRGKARVLQSLAEDAGSSGAALNAGLWLLGSQITRDADVFEQVLSSPAQLRAFIDEQRARSSAWTHWAGTRRTALDTEGATTMNPAPVKLISRLL